ncbi:PREDICTED: cyclin-D5-1-like [Tarenaya hassleriana]|uniref:cyclin-D5-1-like n=1 Tax=Tarenaya hassleriana TaxID=28532 RepID=UPI00053C8259|nr:PREDICTED: cyclin-D5-1-like [Tarenaya hassleriana]
MGETNGTGNGGSSLSGLPPFHETEPCLHEDPCSVDEEYVSELVRRETRRLGSQPDQTAPSSSGRTVAGSTWLRLARLDAVDWIVHTGAKLGLEHPTTYLGIYYLDTFLWRRSIDEGKSWAIRLLSVACLSLAAKMEEHSVPSLSELPSEDYVFGSKVIQRMELLVLSTLDWRMNSVTPFDFLHYFVLKFVKDEPFANGSPSRISESLLEITKEITLNGHRPSVMAAAAVLAASDTELTREELGTKLSSIPWWISSENENVYSCYQIMQEIEERRQRTPDSAIFRGKQPMNSASTDIVDESCLASKRRLPFDGSDQISLAKNMHRP